MEFVVIRSERALILVLLIQTLDLLQGVDSARQCNILDKYQRKPALLNDFHLQQYTRDGLVSYYFNHDFINIYKIIFNITMERWSVIRRDVSFSINAIIPEHIKWTKGVGCPKGFKGDRSNSKVCWPVFDPCPHLNCSDCVITINFGKNAAEIAKYVMNVGIKSVIYHNASNDCPTAPEKYDGMPDELYSTKWRIPQYSNKILGKKPCRDGFNLINFNEPRLHCSERVWKGTKPKCEPILTAATSNVLLKTISGSLQGGKGHPELEIQPIKPVLNVGLTEVSTPGTAAVETSPKFFKGPYFYAGIGTTNIAICLILAFIFVRNRRLLRKMETAAMEEPTYANILRTGDNEENFYENIHDWHTNANQERIIYSDDANTPPITYCNTEEDQHIYCSLNNLNGATRS